MDIQILTIWVNSLALQERLDSMPFLEALVDEHGLVPQRRKAWSAALGSLDLEQHLHNIAIAPEDLSLLLGPVSIRTTAPVPEWVLALDDFIRLRPDSQAHPAQDAGQSLAESLFLVLCHRTIEKALSAACADTRLNAGIDAPLLARQALNCLLPYLDPALQTHSKIMALAGKTGPQYLEWMRGDGLLSFFLQYPVVARLLFVKLQQLADGLAVCLERFCLDAGRICDSFWDGCTLPPLASLHFGLSDLHNGSSSVVLLTFGDGRRLVYKPKNVAAECAYGVLTDWLADNVPGWLPMQTLQVLDCDTYGWANFIDETPETQRTIPQYWRVYGQVIALHYFLGSSDCTASNLIHARTPVIIDHELLMTGLFFRGAEEESFYRQRSAGLVNGPYPLLGSGLVPFHRLSARKFESRSPVSAGSARRFCKEICEGFDLTYRAIANHTGKLSDEIGHLFANIELRFLFRDTDFYHRFLRTLNQASSMKSGIDRSLQAQKLFRACEQANLDDPCYQIVLGEIAALEDGDVPILHCRSGSRDLTVRHRGLQIASALNASPLEKCLSILRDSGAERRELLVRHLRTAFIAHGATGNADEPLEQSLTNCAVRIRDILAAKISSTLFRSSAGVDDFNFYDGFLGHAVFLAAASHECPDPVMQSLLAHQYPRRYAQLFQQCGSTLPRYAGIDLYALTLLGRLTGSGAPLQSALECVRFMQHNRLSLERSDLVGGLAGLCIGLASVYKATQQSEVLAYAIETGERLQQRVGSDAANGQADDAMRFTGMAHGAAGIALAFDRLFEITSEHAFKKCAESMVMFESSLRTADNWWDRVDCRSGERFDGNRCSWCHGAPGIGLARLGMAGTFDGDINHAVACVLKSLRHGPDHICCGELGRVEFLLEAGRICRRPEWTAHAQGIAGTAATGYLAGRIFDLGSSSTETGFFQGLAGIGYQLLRARAPDSLPSVLRFE